MDLFIGRERTTNQLYAKVNKQIFRFGKEGEVPNTVSEDHCFLHITTDNQMEIVNLKEGQNYTFVDGVYVSKATITEDNRIALGPNEWPLDLKGILNFFRKRGILDPLPEKPYEISHLKAVYDKYQNENMQLQIKQGKFAAIRSITGVLSPLAIMLGIYLGTKASFVTFGVYLLIVTSGIFFFYHQWKTSKTGPLERERLLKEFQSNYVCPNPECKRHFGMQPYTEVEKMKSCPYCHKSLVSDGTGQKSKQTE